MKEEWKVYIKGVQGRGSEVKQALINLGGKDSHHFCYDDSEGFFYIDHDGEIRFAQESSEIGKIIMDNYKEIKLSEKWYNGDILINLKTKDFAVYRKDDEFRKETFRDSFYIRNDGTIFSNYPHRNKDFSLALDEETQQFYELLHEHGKDWDDKKKELIDWKCKPKNHERYYYVLSEGTVRFCEWLDDGIDNLRFNIGNCFKTKEEAEAVLEKIKKLLKDKL